MSLTVSVGHLNKKKRRIWSLPFSCLFGYQFFWYWPAKLNMFTERLFSPSGGLHYRYTIAIRGYAKDWTVVGPQVQLRSGLFVCVEVLRPSQQLRSCRVGQLPINTVPGQAGPPSSFASQNYYLFVLNINIQWVWRPSFNRNQLV